jgi:hypothetical protein
MSAKSPARFTMRRRTIMRLRLIPRGLRVGARGQARATIFAAHGHDVTVPIQPPTG